MVTGGSTGWRLEIHESLPSTSDLCITRAEAGEEAGLAVLARRQTHGRGSRGRSWTGQTGNLALSVLLRPAGALHQPALWPFLAALSLHQALGSGSLLQLKWPNDILLGHAKLAGILVERSTGAGPGWLVIGFGANLLRAPTVPARDVACLADVGQTLDAETVAQQVLACLDDWQEIYHRGGFDVIRSCWLARAHPPGTVLAVESGGIRQSGSFVGLATDGALLIEIAGREQRIDTGEVLLPHCVQQPAACG